MRLFCAYLKKVICSPITYISVLLVFLITGWGMLGVNFGSIDRAIKHLKQTSIVESYNFMMNIGSFRRLTIFAASLPFTAQFCTELKNNAVNQIVVRSSRSRYIISHIVMCFLTSFAVAFIGIMLCIALLSTFVPFCTENGNVYYDAFFSLMNSADTAPFLVLWSAFDFSFSVGMWTMSGLALSAVFPDTFVALCAPLIMSYVLEFVTFEVDFLPDMLAISLTYVNVSDNRLVCALYIIAVMSIFTAAFACIFGKFAGRRIKNEMR